MSKQQQQVSEILGKLATSIELQTNTLNGLTTALGGIRVSCDNTSQALVIVQNTLSNLNGNLERHDKRSEFMNEDIIKIATYVSKQ